MCGLFEDVSLNMYLLEHIDECNGYKYISKLSTSFLNFLERRGRLRLIPSRNGNSSWMKRYYLLFKGSSVTEKRWYTRWVPFNVMIHHIVESDEEDIHNHPWPFFVLILKGGYWEYTNSGKHWRGPGFWALRFPNHFHRIELKDEDGSWSLFIRGPKIRNWGFRVEDEFIPHEEYLKSKLDVVPLNEQIK